MEYIAILLKNFTHFVYVSLSGKYSGQMDYPSNKNRSVYLCIQFLHA